MKIRSKKRSRRYHLIVNDVFILITCNNDEFRWPFHVVAISKVSGLISDRVIVEKLTFEIFSGLDISGIVVVSNFHEYVMW